MFRCGLVDHLFIALFKGNPEEKYEKALTWNKFNHFFEKDLLLWKFVSQTCYSFDTTNKIKRGCKLTNETNYYQKSNIWCGQAYFTFLFYLSIDTLAIYKKWHILMVYDFESHQFDINFAFLMFSFECRWCTVRSYYEDFINKGMLLKQKLL